MEIWCVKLIKVLYKFPYDHGVGALFANVTRFLLYVYTSL
jgi:hypothetical protein